MAPEISKYNQFLITDQGDLAIQFEDFSRKARIPILDWENITEVAELSSDKFIQIILYLSHPFLQKNIKNLVNILKFHPTLLVSIIIIGPLDLPVEELGLEDEHLYTIVPKDSPKKYVARTLLNALGKLMMTKEGFELQRKLGSTSNEISKLTKIGRSLAYEKDFTKLLREILNSAIEISNSDGGSLYLVEDDASGNPVNLRFKISAMDLDSEEFTLPIDKKSIAGYVATTGVKLNIPDVYKIPSSEEYKFNSSFDDKHNYHCRSMLTVPMKNHENQIIGVVQLINRKKNWKQKLSLEELKTDAVLPYDKYSEELVMAVAGQAAMAIQNNNLIRDIENLFEGFVTASVSAIESRDPTTSGHSFRVALLTTTLAEALNQTPNGKYGNIHFGVTQMREIRYASLLHDFGKVGVREKVLVKAKKLEEYDLALIQARFKYVQKDLELQHERQINKYLIDHGKDGFESFKNETTEKMKEELSGIKRMIDAILKANEPTILEESHSQLLEQIFRTNYSTTDGEQITLLHPGEYNYLKIRKGTLDETERKEIESHVSYTFQFLSKIPWTSGLKNVPNIAHAHHEKLNGRGYPLGLKEEQIPIQSKMMAISDIFDALTDKDRPYKRAVPLDKALDILQMEVNDNHLDAELFNIFINARVFDSVISIKANA